MNLYHVAPASQKKAILENGILPLMQQGFRRTEEEAIRVWMRRWAKRTSRTVAETEHLYQDAAYDVHRVCVFQDLAVAQRWAAADPRKMVIFVVDGKDYAFRQDVSADLTNSAEAGALSTSEAISPSDIRVL